MVLTANSSRIYATPKALLVRYIESHPNEKFALSTDLISAVNKKIKNVVKPTEADTFIYRNQDLRRRRKTIKLNDYPSIYHNTFKWLGLREVNYNYYVSWKGDRILLVPMKKADQMGLTSAIGTNY